MQARFATPKLPILQLKKEQAIEERDTEVIKKLRNKVNEHVEFRTYLGVPKTTQRNLKGANDKIM